MSSSDLPQQQTVFGHPAGLFTLFFAEMWERFSYYGMRALLVFYMIKGFMGYGDSDAYAVYGAYTALVYMTPFFGGMLADKLLGARRAVILGGLLMAAGHLLMTVEQEFAFFTALALLIAGNGFFKPNISTIVGSLYPKGSPKRDGGFTIFYMGINMGAAMSPLLCGYIGETYGWHYGFGLATIGMLVGVAVFVAPIRLTQILIMSGAAAAALALFYFHPGDIFVIAANVFTGVLLLIAGVVAWIALGRGGLPQAAGAPPDLERLRRPVLGILSAEHLVYLGTLVAIPVFTLLVSGLAVLRDDSRGVTLISDQVIERLEANENPVIQIAATVIKEISRPAGLALVASGIVAAIYLLTQTFRLDRIPRQRMYVVLILTFFSMLFWSFFEQAGSSLNNFADRNVDRVYEDRTIDETDVGSTIKFRIPTETSDTGLKQLPILSQEQLGRVNENEQAKAPIEQAIRAVEEEKNKLEPDEIDKLVSAVLAEDRFTMTGLTYLRDFSKKNTDSDDAQVLEWKVAESNVGMGFGGSEVPASIFQAVNPLYIVVLGLVFSLTWAIMAKRGIEPSTPVKFSLGLVQLGLGFGAFWWGSTLCDGDGMVALAWLFLGYLLHTTGELCLSPVGLGMVTRLSPVRLVSTVMGAWFLATAFSQFLAAIIAQFTGVSEGGGEGTSALPVPLETVHVYGGVFKIIAMCAIASGIVCLFLSPVLKYWMHTELEGKEEEE
jgi:POT family proton-dependent oligopeptide transporter